MLNNKILVIDDEQPIIHSIYRTTLLEDDEYEILPANNGKKGLEIYYREKPVLVILDLKMPVMGGIEFLENIQLTPSDPSSVIVMTGYGNDENIKTCFDLGISAFIRKPFNKYEFIGLVRHTIALKRMQQNLQQEFVYRKFINEPHYNEKTRFSSAMLTELKNAAVPIADSAALLLNDRLATDAEKDEKLRTIHKNAEDMLNIIESASTVVRDCTSLQSFNPEDLDFSRVLTRVAGHYLSDMTDRGITIIINGKGFDRWHTLEKNVISADYHQIKSLIENLLDNAAKHAKESVHIELSSNGSWIEFAVANDGSNIEGRYQEKIFEEFFQTPESTMGTGMGLYIVKRIVENHGGRIDVSSSEEEGARFVLAFPSTSSPSLAALSAHEHP